MKESGIRQEMGTTKSLIYIPRETFCTSARQRDAFVCQRFAVSA
jgi:hypothetical protein